MKNSAPLLPVLSFLASCAYSTPQECLDQVSGEQVEYRKAYLLCNDGHTRLNGTLGCEALERESNSIKLQIDFSFLENPVPQDHRLVVSYECFPPDHDAYAQGLTFGTDFKVLSEGAYLVNGLSQIWAENCYPDDFISMDVYLVPFSDPQNECEELLGHWKIESDEDSTVITEYSAFAPKVYSRKCMTSPCG